MIKSVQIDCYLNMRLSNISDSTTFMYFVIRSLNDSEIVLYYLSFCLPKVLCTIKYRLRPYRLAFGNRSVHRTTTMNWSRSRLRHRQNGHSHRPHSKITGVKSYTAVKGRSRRASKSSSKKLSSLWYQCDSSLSPS